MKLDFFINVSEEKLDELGSSSESEEEESKTIKDEGKLREEAKAEAP